MSLEQELGNFRQDLENSGRGSSTVPEEQMIKNNLTEREGEYGNPCIYICEFKYPCARQCQTQNYLNKKQ